MLTKAFITVTLLQTASSARRIDVQEQLIVEQSGCPPPAETGCPGGTWFCPKDRGCYPGNDVGRCGEPLCSPEGKLGPNQPQHQQPAASGKPPPSPQPSYTAPVWKPPSGGGAFKAVDTTKPPKHAFPSNSGHYMPPRRISAPGKHQTNKFWTNWISGKGPEQKPIFTMPYCLKWGDNPARAELTISHSDPTINYATGDREGRIAWYMSKFRPSFAVATKEGTNPKGFEVTKEGQLGIHAQVQGSHGGSVTFPLYRGQAYITGNYHDMTPRITSPQGFIKKMKKVKEGVFEFKNDEGDPDKSWNCHYYQNGENDAWCKSNPRNERNEMNFFGPDGTCGDCHCCERPLPKPEDKGKDFGNVYRVWVLEYNGNPLAGAEFTNTSEGFVMNKRMKGWLRIAHIVNDRDAGVLDTHASAVLEDVELQTNADNSKFGYRFETKGHGELLHWAWIHQKMLMHGPKTYEDHQITHILAPTKGNMVPVRGSQWNLEIDIGGARGLQIMPPKPSGGKLDAVKAELDKDLAKAEKCSNMFGGVHANGWATAECEWPRVWLFAAGFYNNGKGLQRLGTTCLMGKTIYGSNDPRVVKCSNLLQAAFECHFNPGNCGGVPLAYYDEKWGGIASRQAFNTDMCGLADFGNACYNDHHYHYGYIIHAGAQLLALKPDMKGNTNFIAYINSMVRDVSNPSTADPYFPQFRAFDWYDLHSWSHGVTPSNDGKDEESTSEDMNAYFGIQMWAKLNNAQNLEHVAAMQLSLLAHSVKNIFLIKDSNQVHPKDYIKNRATGIFFESKAHYGTFFGASSIFIHGIQMMPLTPALPLARDKEFCVQEWHDIVSKIPLPMGGSHGGWGSLLITGNVAFHDPEKAWHMINAQHEFDGGLSKAWAMYWVAHMAR